MHVIMVMFDSLNRHMLSPYGCDKTVTPNFARLANSCTTFDRCYVGSMPCMPARRELHTGRLNFLHRSWGPLEPFDDSAIALMKESGIYTHLVSDHYHYWEEGGATYHTKYNTAELVRGQEGDCWKGIVNPVELPARLGIATHQDQVNRSYIEKRGAFPQENTFSLGLDFIEANKDADNWFLQIETFDPHEPFFAPRDTKGLYEWDYDALHYDWPRYQPVSPEEKFHVDHVRHNYYALLSLCDRQLGRVLDKMDELDLWQDTMLIVNTDHGFLLGEHGWWAKSNDVNFYEEVAHTPLFIYDPRCRTVGRNGALVQTIDLAPTLLEYYGLPIPRDMQGQVLRDTLRDGRPTRDSIICGMYGAQITCVKGRYKYVLAPQADNTPLYNYTLMPTHMRKAFHVKELQALVLAEPFPFTKGCRTLKIADVGLGDAKLDKRYRSMLFDLERDPEEMNPIHDTEVERDMKEEIIALMFENDAPTEQYDRMGLPRPYGVY